MTGKHIIYFLLAITLYIAIESCKKDNLTGDNVKPYNFLSGSKYEKLVVELQSMSGYAPTAEAKNHLLALLKARLNKPDGITLSENSIAAKGKSFYSVEDIKDIEESSRTQHTKGSTLTAYILFLDGEYAGNSGNSKVLGITYSGTSMAIFEKTIREYSGGLTLPSTHVLESTVVEHEFGHVLGLVNNGTAMQASHQDVQNGQHCNNSNCLMYYQTETTDIIGSLLGNDIPEFDTNCLNDLKANGGK